MFPYAVILADFPVGGEVLVSMVLKCFGLRMPLTFLKTEKPKQLLFMWVIFIGIV